MSQNIVSVSQISNYIKNIFDAETSLQSICVYGEVSSFNISGRNAYFTLKDENALLNCTMFGFSGTAPKIGDVILAFGGINYYEKGGRLSFNVLYIQPYGKGLLYERFLQLKQKLEDKGYFDDSHKQAIPKYVKRIGVVSSDTGAVIHDIQNVTTRRNNSVDIVLYPVKVQGVGADVEIAKAIDFFSTYPDVDVVIVARGGGSAEDLDAFNQEIVAESAYKCKKPLISAVGHETDFTIIDFVADLRAPTPSAAAELAVYDKSQFIDELLSHIDYQSDYITSTIKNLSNSLDTLYTKQSSTVLNQISKTMLNINNFVNQSYNTINDRIIKLEKHLTEQNIYLTENNPSNILAKGYAVLTKQDKPLKSVKQIHQGEILDVRMADGKTKVVAQGEK